MPGEGFDVRSGVLHGPGTALTLELQEDSDVLSMFQALNAGKIISKELLFKDVPPRTGRGRASEPRWASWTGTATATPTSTCTPTWRRCRWTGMPEWGRRDWVFFGNRKFSGQRVTVAPGRRARIVEPGVYSVFAWSGTGTWGGHELAGGVPGRDELLVAFTTATAGVDVVSHGPEPFVGYLLSGPDLHPEAAVVHGAGV